MASSYVLFLITLIALYYLCSMIMKKSSTERFQDTASADSKTASSITDSATDVIDKKDKIQPTKTGVVFGYLPQEIKKNPIEYKLDPNTIYSGGSIVLNNKNLYLGAYEKNPLLPTFLEKIGTFRPYEYSTIKVFVKDNNFNITAALEEIPVSKEPPAPIFYNKTIICFMMKYLQENYFLQFLPKTNTFYLTKKPSYFLVINAMDSYLEKEVRYGDSVLLRCLDNSELLLVYDNFIITESDKSSTFVMNKSETIDICTNFQKSEVDLKQFLPQYIDPQRAAALDTISKSQINNYINTLKNTQFKDVANLKKELALLETKRNNLKAKKQLNNDGQNLELKVKFDKEKEKIQNEIAAYEKQMNTDFESYKKQFTIAKTAQWDKEITSFKNELAKKC